LRRAKRYLEIQKQIKHTRLQDHTLMTQLENLNSSIVALEIRIRNENASSHKLQRIFEDRANKFLRGDGKRR